MKLLTLKTEERIIGSRLYHAMVDEDSFEKINDREPADVNHIIKAKLEPDAVLTDLIKPGNLSAKGFIISEKLATLICQFNLGEHRFYKTILSDYDLGSYDCSYIHFIPTSGVHGIFNFEKCL